MTITPSILSDSIEEVAHQLDRVHQESQLGRVQIDIVDPEFADEVTIHPIDLLDVNTYGLEIDFHLMTNDPIQDVIECSQVNGIHAIIAQIERMRSQQDFVEHVESYHILSGFSLDLFTQVEEIDQLLLQRLSIIQVMGNKAGKQGQQFAGDIVLEKITTLVALREKSRLNFQIAVDIGMNPENAARVIAVGADIIAPGSYLWTAPNLQNAIERYPQTL